MIYSEEDFIGFRSLKHAKRSKNCKVEWVFPGFGEPVLTFDRITYYNAYADRDELTEEQLEILRKEGPLGCPPF